MSVKYYYRYLVLNQSIFEISNSPFKGGATLFYSRHQSNHYTLFIVKVEIDKVLHITLCQ